MPVLESAGGDGGPEIATSIAAAMLPEKEYEKAFFTDAPRRVLAHLLRRKPQVRDLLRWMSDPEEIAAIVKGTPLAAYLDPRAPAQRAGILSSMNMVADSLELLPQYAEPNDPRGLPRERPYAAAKAGAGHSAAKAGDRAEAGTQL